MIEVYVTSPSASTNYDDIDREQLQNIASAFDSKPQDGNRLICTVFKNTEGTIIEGRGPVGIEEKKGLDGMDKSYVTYFMPKKSFVPKNDYHSQSEQWVEMELDPISLFLRYDASVLNLRNICNVSTATTHFQSIEIKSFRKQSGSEEQYEVRASVLIEDAKVLKQELLRTEGAYWLLIIGHKYTFESKLPATGSIVHRIISTMNRR